MKIEQLIADGLLTNAYFFSGIQIYQFHKDNELRKFLILVVEDIHKKREPLGTMEAVYLITPSEDSVRCLMKDFEHPNRPMYKGAHVYFTEGKPTTFLLLKLVFLFCLII